MQYAMQVCIISKNTTDIDVIKKTIRTTKASSQNAAC
uniref:Transposase n=1 Tax=Ascaris lumbricoides TaxID=6252 RepID=A0A0M3I5L0_ASCLU